MHLGNSTGCTGNNLLRYCIGHIDRLHAGGKRWRLGITPVCSVMPLSAMSPVMTERRHSWLAGLHYHGLSVQEEPPPPPPPHPGPLADTGQVIADKKNQGVHQNPRCIRQKMARQPGTYSSWRRWIINFLNTFLENIF